MTEGSAPLVRLRPVTEQDLDPLDDMFNDPDAIGEYNWGGFSDPTKWRRQWQENGLLGDSSVLIVDLNGEPLGFVSWHRVPTSSHAYVVEFGISLWPRWRGKGYGTAAQVLLARYLFAHSPVNRIQAWTEADNVGEQRALEKAGFVREAVLREYAFRDGAWRDEIMYRMLRRELP
ncbi:N-acetyltransferase [Actinophytocola xinjiangensis]|uniref:N-acetyltransferase n=1 Tax=Actinophytocola xinjiangensis TaxID=485602 RepID=A0A7Z0WCP5_9PSEU|nr:GNAT family protein [Actinophytocola xinjiangensis]OLF04391.1 N-acetyltransferase [Actinophytocola xinjiangensis]